MRTQGMVILVVLALQGATVRSQEPISEPVPEPAPAASMQPPAPAATTEAAPLMLAADRTPKVIFQIGADGGGLTMGGASGIAGTNASMVYPVTGWLWAGVQTALQYVFPEDRKYQASWFQANASFQFNVLNEPVRFYAFAVGGYALALDNDLYQGVAHGWNVSAGVGVSWHPEGESLGLFAELGFLLARAGRDQTVLKLDAQGKPIYDDTTNTWETEPAHRDYGLTTLTLNLGLQYQMLP